MQNILAIVRSYDDLADALATQRRRSGLSLELVAKRAGFGADVLRRLEEKKQFPGVKLTAWMAALGIILSVIDCDERPEFELSIESRLPNSPENYRAVRKRVAAKGGRWRAWTLSKRRRRQIARKAGLASAAKRREERLRRAMPGRLHVANRGQAVVAPLIAGSLTADRSETVARADA
jgi:transcriptional regulator with XRE-family HTH domain